MLNLFQIAVWRRFTDFKKLHQELLKIYLFKDLKEEQFPPFPKAKFFGNNIKVFSSRQITRHSTDWFYILPLYYWVSIHLRDLARRVFSHPMDSQFWKKNHENLLIISYNFMGKRAFWLPVFNVWLKAWSTYGAVFVDGGRFWHQEDPTSESF